MTKSVIPLSKMLAAAGMFAGIAVADATAANQFRGNACIITATAACGPIGWSVGSCASARFVPPNWNGGPNRTTFSFFWGNFAQNFAADGSLVSATYRAVQAGQIGNSFSSYTGSLARIAGQAPAAPVAGSVFLSNTIYITRFDNTVGCNIALRFQGQRFPLP